MLGERFAANFGARPPLSPLSFGPALADTVAPALAERLTLLINHVLASEPVAGDRLRAHAGRSVQLVLESWPALLPPPPPLAWRVSAAGLLEWIGGDPLPAGIDLSLRLDASNPAALMFGAIEGAMPTVQIEGDAQLAGDVNWLMQNLRWDVAADLDRLFGPAVAQQLHQVGTLLAGGVRSALKAAADLRSRWPGRAG